MSEVPVHLIKTPELLPPENGICYLVGKNGIFKQIKNPFYVAIVKETGVGHFAEITEKASLFVPKFPIDLLRKVEAFFLAVYKKYESEAVVILLCNPLTGVWKTRIPKQKVGVRGLHVSYEASSVDVPAGFEIFGTIHSHAYAGAFHSTTDDRDEDYMDGLHVTIGNLGSPVLSYAARWMICGTPYTATLSDVIAFPELPGVSEEWMARVEKDVPAATFPGQWKDNYESWRNGKETGAGSEYATDLPLGAETKTETPAEQEVTIAVPACVPFEFTEEYLKYMETAHEEFMLSLTTEDKASTTPLAEVKT